MKRILLIIAAVLILLPSCYVTTIEQYTLTVTDNGQYGEDRTKHIVSITAPDDFGDIYYTIDGKNPGTGSVKYVPRDYVGTDTKTYKGVLIAEDTTLKAVSYRNESGKNVASFVTELFVSKVVTYAPTISYNGDTKNGKSCVVQITVSDGSEIYYTSDGSDPRTKGILYKESEYTCDDGSIVKGIVVESGRTVSAVSKKSGCCSEESRMDMYSASSFSPVLTFLGIPDGEADKYIISLSSSIPDAVITYTLDDTDPSSGTEYEATSIKDSDGNEVSGILIPAGCVIRAYAVVGERESTEIRRQYYSASQFVPKITNLVSSKDEPSKQVVSMTCADENAVIRYTTDGSDPKTSDTALVYESQSHATRKGSEAGVLIESGCTVRSVAENGNLFSDEVSMRIESSFTWAPVITNLGSSGVDTGNQIIRITSADSSAEILYTTDGTDPVGSGKAYTEESCYSNEMEEDVTGILVKAGTRIRAVAKRDDVYSEEIVETVTANVSWTPKYEYIAPSSEEEGMEVIRLSSYDKTVSIYYTTDGSDPSGSAGVLYEEQTLKYPSTTGKEILSGNGILVPTGCTVRAVARKGSGYSSEVVNVASGIQGLTVLMSDCGNSYYSYKEVIALSSLVSSASIYYTTDGKDPRTVGVLYSPSSIQVGVNEYADGIAVSSGTTIRAVATCWGMYSAEFSWTVYSASGFAPVISEKGESADDETKEIVSLSTCDSSAVIYYTLDGSDPKKNGLVYVESTLTDSDGDIVLGILVDSGTKLRAVAKAQHGGYSNVVESAIYTLSAFTPVVSFAGEYSEYSNRYVIVTLTSASEDIEIYYTTDGKDPEKSGTKYSKTSRFYVNGEYFYGVRMDSGSTLKAVAKKEDRYTPVVEEVIYHSSSFAPVSSLVGLCKDDITKAVITLTSPDEEAEIYYALGIATDPKTDGTLYTESEYTDTDGNTISGILIESGKIIRAVAKNSKGRYSSELKTEVKGIYESPVRITETGILKSDEGKQIIKLSHVDSTATIFYTTDGTDPKEKGTQYTEESYEEKDGGNVSGILIQSGRTLKAVAKNNNGEYYGELEQKILNPSVWAPSFVNNGESADNPGSQIIQLKPSSNAQSSELYYTTDGSDPLEVGILYKAESYTDRSGGSQAGVLVTAGSTVKVVAKDGDLFSSVMEFTASSTSDWAPVITNGGADGQGYQIINMTSSDSDAEIYYTIDGYNPKTSSSSTKYSASTCSDLSGESEEGVKIYKGKTIRAVAKKDGVYSDETKFDVLDTASWMPVVSYLDEYQYDETDAIIKMTTSASNVVILYTTDGKDPRTDGMEYIGEDFFNNDKELEGIRVEIGSTVKCVARKTLDSSSETYLYSDVTTFIAKRYVKMESYSTYYEWERNSSLDVTGYTGYSSTNYNASSYRTYAVMKLTIFGFDSFSFYINSNGYSRSNDYVYVTNVDSSSPTTSVKFSRYGYSFGGTALSDYNEVTYTNLGGTEHYIYVVYQKNCNYASTSYRGYVLLPSEYIVE